jgi:hypothetical protein
VDVVVLFKSQPPRTWHATFHVYETWDQFRPTVQNPFSRRVPLTLGTKNRIPETEPNYPKTEPNFPNRSVSVPSSVPISEYPKYPSTEPKFPNRTEVPEVPEFAQS